MNSFKTYLMLLFTLILTATLFFSCSDSDSKSIPFPEEFHGTWVWMNNSITPIDFGDDEKINALIIDIGKNNLEVRGYRYTDHELAARMVLIDLDGDTFTLKQTDYVDDAYKWVEDYEIIEIDFILNEAKTEITLKPGGLGGIPPMKKTNFIQLGDLIGTWTCTKTENGDTVNVELIIDNDGTYDYTETKNSDSEYVSGTWDVSEDKTTEFDGIFRTITTSFDDHGGFSYGGASPYKFVSSNQLKIWYPNDDDPDGIEPVEFTRQTP